MYATEVLKYSNMENSCLGNSTDWYRNTCDVVVSLTPLLAVSSDTTNKTPYIPHSTFATQLTFQPYERVRTVFSIELKAFSMTAHPGQAEKLHWYEATHKNFMFHIIGNKYKMFFTCFPSVFEPWLSFIFAQRNIFRKIFTGMHSPCKDDCERIQWKGNIQPFIQIEWHMN